MECAGVANSSEENDGSPPSKKTGSRFSSSPGKKDTEKDTFISNWYKTEHLVKGYNMIRRLMMSIEVWRETQFNCYGLCAILCE